MRIVFLGTPDFSVPTLEALINSKHDVVAVVTQPDRRRDKNVLSFSPVKECALKYNVPVLQYEKIKLEGVDDLKDLNPDMMVTCAYGQIISQEILDIPKYGVINVHASLLPKYRGSSPIQWCLINGETKTGVTIMKTALGVDSGDIIYQEEIDIAQKETADSLFEKLSHLGPNALLKAIDQIEDGSAKFIKQDDSKATHFPMLSKDDGKINWEDSAVNIKNKVFGLNPWPSAFTTLNNKMFKIWNVDVVENENLKPGEVKVVNKNMIVGCGVGALSLIEVQLEGKKRMQIDAFLLGNKVDGEILG